MSFQPLIPIGGYVGWKFLQSSLPVQNEAFRSGAEIKRDTEHARNELGAVTSAEQLVGDRQLLKVALGAFGLQDDLPNRAFVERVLADGSIESDALSNRLADKRYRAFAAAFGFGTGEVPGSLKPGFVEGLVEDYQTRAFEIAVGEQSNEMRLAFTFAREAQDIASGTTGDDTKWFTVMGNPPLREVFETALGLPEGFGSLDLDQQLGVFRERLESFTGDGEISQFADPEKREEFVRLYLLRSELASGPSINTPGMGALMILQNIQRPSASLLGTALLG